MAFRREKKRIGDMLINENVITQEQLEKALPIAKEKHKKIHSLSLDSPMSLR